MITVWEGIVAGAADVGVVALEDWSCGDFSAYICFLNGFFNLTKPIISKNISHEHNE